MARVRELLSLCWPGLVLWLHLAACSWMNARSYDELTDSHLYPVLHIYGVFAPFLTALFVVASALFIGRVWLSDSGAALRWIAALVLVSGPAFVLHHSGY